MLKEWGERIKGWTGKNRPQMLKQQQSMLPDYYKEIARECELAKKEWTLAQAKLEWVTDRDQIDFAIYSLIAAEKHYVSLLNEAKKLFRDHQDRLEVQALMDRSGVKLD